MRFSSLMVWKGRQTEWQFILFSDLVCANHVTKFGILTTAAEGGHGQIEMLSYILFFVGESEYGQFHPKLCVFQ